MPEDEFSTEDGAPEYNPVDTGKKIVDDEVLIMSMAPFIQS